MKSEQVRNRIVGISHPAGPYPTYTPPLGVRQPTPRPPPGEGGLLDDCSGAELSVQKKRAARIVAAGLAPPWRAVLEEIGPDVFLRAVRALHAATPQRDHQRRVRIPTPKRFDGVE